MLNCDNKPSIYLWLQINGNKLGVNNLLFRHYSCIFTEKNNKIKYSKPLTFTFNVIKHLTFIGEYFGWCKCVVTGVQPGFHSVPLHHIKLKSNLVSGQVVVVVGPTLPVEDIALILGIDMPDDKAILAPIISEEPSYEENELKKYRDFSSMCCNFSHEKASGRRGYLMQAGTIETSDVESKDTLFCLMSTITCCRAMAICLVIS